MGQTSIHIMVVVSAKFMFRGSAGVFTIMGECHNEMYYIIKT